MRGRGHAGRRRHSRHAVRAGEDARRPCAARLLRRARARQRTAPADRRVRSDARAPRARPRRRPRRRAVPAIAADAAAFRLDRVGRRLAHRLARARALPSRRRRCVRRGLDVAERVALDRRLSAARSRRISLPERTDRSPSALPRTPRRAFAAIWTPLCLAALNTPPRAASAQIFANVLRAAFTGAARNSELLVPAVDLSACFPEAAARFVERA